MNTENRKIYSCVVEYKPLIYPVLLYALGLLIGTVIFKVSEINQFESIFKTLFDSEDLLTLFLNRLSIYCGLYLFSVLFGMCIIGFPVIYIIPVITGFVIAFKTAYFYSNYSVKGIGYSLLLIIPEAAVYITLLIFTVSKSFDLSKKLLKETVNKTDMTQDINLKSYLKYYVLLFILAVLIAFINSLIIFLFQGLISL